LVFNWKENHRKIQLRKSGFSTVKPDSRSNGLYSWQSGYSTGLWNNSEYWVNYGKPISKVLLYSKDSEKNLQCPESKQLSKKTPVAKFE
jgi:hypothetical protein